MPFKALYASVQLKRLNNSFYQFEIRSEKKLLLVASYLKTLPLKIKTADSPHFYKCDQCWNQKSATVDGFFSIFVNNENHL